jgi:hypothetical protein
MRIITDYSLSRLENSDSPKSELFFRGDSTQVIVDGVNLIAQFETIDGSVLLVLDEDILYEECLHFILLKHQKISDHISFGAPYVSGIFRQIEVNKNGLTFCFFGDDLYELEIAETASRFGKHLPAGVHRHGPWLAHKYITVTRTTNLAEEQI